MCIFTKINTVLLLLSVTLTGFLIKESANWRQYSGGWIEQEREGMVRKIDELQNRVSAMLACAGDAAAYAESVVISREDMVEIANLIDRLESVQSELATQNSSGQAAYANGAHQEKSFEERAEYNRAANALVDNFIERGMIGGNDMIQLHQHLSRMDPQQQQEALQRLVMAINEQWVDIEPGILP